MDALVELEEVDARQARDVAVQFLEQRCALDLPDVLAMETLSASWAAV